MAEQDCQHDDTFQGVCVWCKKLVGDEPEREQWRTVGAIVAGQGKAEPTP